MSDSIKKTNPLKQAFIDALEIPYLRIIAPIVYILVCAIVYPFNYKLCEFENHLIPLSYYSISVLFFSFMVFFLTAENKIEFLTKEFPDFIISCAIFVFKIFLYLAIASLLTSLLMPFIILSLIITYFFKNYFLNDFICKIYDMVKEWIFKENINSC